MTLRKRCVILGLDGLPLSLARELANLDGFPALRRICRTATTVRAELPELSPVNWTSFFTGCGPGEHGIYGFSRFDSHSYELSIADFSNVAVPTIFDRLGERGLTSKVVNLPNTYPARPFPGLLVSGFVAHDLFRAVYPPMFAHALARQGYILEADTTRAATEHNALLAALSASLFSRRKALDLFWPDLAWDVFCFVITETDRLFHFLFNAVEDPDHLLHTACLGLLRQVDALAAEILDRFDALPDPKRLVVLADHGFTRTIVEVDVNAWLLQHGYLQLDGPSSEWDATHISPQSRAFALDPSRIYVHKAHRFARGRVSSSQVQALTLEIATGLARLEYEGQPVLKAVHPGAFYYSGPQACNAPDLVLEANSGFDLKAKFDRTRIFGHFGRTGCHTPDQAIFYDSHGAKPERMRDVGREVLQYWGVE
jgi:predicted AlkP superfamily phosphohydrolase/phosphomutase